MVATILIEIGKRFLGAYLAKAFSISQLYGSLGLVPLFMFWVYLMWLFVLFGLEVSATLQMVRGRHLEDLPSQLNVAGLFDPASIFTVMEVVARRFESGEATTARQIADRTRVAETVVATMFEHLVDADFLYRIDDQPAAVCLARPPEQISAEMLLDVSFSMVGDGTPKGPSLRLDHLRRAQMKLVHDESLATMIGKD